MKINYESAMICAESASGMIPVCRLEYYEDESNNFYYVFTPVYENIDKLSYNEFHGIQGVNLNLRKKEYVRKNYVPTFISERSPIPTRMNLNDLMDEAGIEKYNPVLWLKKTKMKYFGDNYIVCDEVDDEYL